MSGLRIERIEKTTERLEDRVERIELRVDNVHERLADVPTKSDFSDLRGLIVKHLANDAERWQQKRAKAVNWALIALSGLMTMIAAWLGVT